MNDSATGSYDQVPYTGRPTASTHPDNLAKVATLLGMEPPPPDQARILEIGCGTGANLLSIASSLPNATCFGFDMSGIQIHSASQLATRLELSQVMFEQRDLLEVSEADLGTMDYIICHGVYSWVPKRVQEKILQICKGCLSPQGVAYISYNTLPGWHLRACVRDMLRMHAQRFEDPTEQIRQARAFMEFLGKGANERDRAFRELIDHEVQLVRRSPDWYFYHEFLESENRPLYFHEFMSDAATHELAFLGEADFHTSLEFFPDDVQQILTKVAPNLLAMEQYTDFLMNRQFRRTLLCHAGTELVRTPPLERLMSWEVSATAQPQEATVDLSSEVETSFITKDGRNATTNQPELKAIILTLAEWAPKQLPFDRLWQLVRSRLAAAGVDPPASTEIDRMQLAGSLLRLFVNGMLDLHATPARFTVDVSEFPLASPLARHQATTDDVVTSIVGKVIPMDDFDRQVLIRLDGKHSRDHLIAELRTLVAAGTLTISSNADVVEPMAIEDIDWPQAIDRVLHKLARWRLLMTDSPSVTPAQLAVH